MAWWTARRSMRRSTRWRATPRPGPPPRPRPERTCWTRCCATRWRRKMSGCRPPAPPRACAPASPEAGEELFAGVGTLVRLARLLRDALRQIATDGPPLVRRPGLRGGGRAATGARLPRHGVRPGRLPPDHGRGVDAARRDPGRPRVGAGRGLRRPGGARRHLARAGGRQRGLARAARRARRSSSSRAGWS